MVKVEALAKVHSTQFGFHGNEGSALQLLKGISNDLQKLLNYFGGTAIFTPFLFVTRLDLYLNDEELFVIWLSSTVKLTFSSISFL